MTNKEAIEIIDMFESIVEQHEIDGDMEREKQALTMAIQALEQQPFINKPCVSEGVCREDKIQVLEKIRTEIEQIADEEQKHDEKWAIGLRYAVKIIDKYREGGAE